HARTPRLFGADLGGKIFSRRFLELVEKLVADRLFAGAIDRLWSADGKLETGPDVAVAHRGADGAGIRGAPLGERAPLAPAIAVGGDEVDAVGAHECVLMATVRQRRVGCGGGARVLHAKRRARDTASNPTTPKEKGRRSLDRRPAR